MSRQPTPINILDDLMPLGNGAAAIRQALLWDYDQLGADADAVRQHAVEIKLSERRANDAVIDAGRHLIAVKERLQHGQWTDWLQIEFSMTDRTARTLMSIAERFDGKTEIISDLSVTVLGLLASPSVPDAAVAAVIDASASGKVTVAQAKVVIEQHKPPKPAAPRRYESGLPALNMPAPTAPAPAVVAADARPLPAWVTAEPEPEPLTAADLHVMQTPPALGGLEHLGTVIGAAMGFAALSPDIETATRRTREYLAEHGINGAFVQTPAPPADDRVGKMVRLIGIYKFAISTFDEYGNLTGHHVETLSAKREIEKLIARLEREGALLEGRPVADGWMVEEAA